MVSHAALNVHNGIWQRSGSVVECLTRDLGVADLSPPAALCCILEHNTLIPA